MTLILLPTIMPPAQVRALIPFIHNQGRTPLATIYDPHKCGFKCLAGKARGILHYRDSAVI